MADWFDEQDGGDPEDPLYYADYENPDGSMNLYEDRREPEPAWDPRHEIPTEGPGAAGQPGVAFYGDGPGEDVLGNLDGLGIPYQLIAPTAAPGTTPPGVVPPATLAPILRSGGSGSGNYPGIPNPRDFPRPNVPRVMPSPDPLKPWEERFTAPTEQEALNTPGFQFRLGEGLKALERSAAAKGTLLTGGTGKGLQNYAQDAASQEYGKTYDRAFNEYESRRTGFLNNEANRYNSQRSNLLDQFGMSSDVFGMERGNRLDDWGINSDYFNMGQAQRMNDFGIESGNRNMTFTELLEMAKLNKPPSPYAGY